MKILILGGAGMLGHQIYLKTREAFGASNVALTLRKAQIQYEKFGIFNDAKVFDNLDILDFSNVLKILDQFKPQVVINCIGLTLRKKELADIEKCYSVNGVLPHKIAMWGQFNNCKIIHFSTDCVFDGSQGNYKETDVPTALDSYGQSKFLGEIQSPNSLTLRLSIVGRELEAKTELVEWFLSQKGKTIQGYSNAIYSGLTTNFVAHEVVKIIKNFPKLSGLYHLASEPISKFELLKIVNQVYSTKIEIIENSNYKSDKSLNSDRYSSATGFVKPKWQDLILQMKNEEQVNYDQR